MLLVLQKKISCVKDRISWFCIKYMTGGIQKSVDTLISGYSQKCKKERLAIQQWKWAMTSQNKASQSKAYNKKYNTTTKLTQK